MGLYFSVPQIPVFDPRHEIAPKGCHYFAVTDDARHVNLASCLPRILELAAGYHTSLPSISSALCVPRNNEAPLPLRFDGGEFNTAFITSYTELFGGASYLQGTGRGTCSQP